MGASVLSGVSGIARSTGLFGPPTGANAGIFTTSEKIGGVTTSSIGIVSGLTQAGLLGGSGGAVGSFAALAGPIALGAVVALAILSKIFHGADPLQVPAAQVEQAFEAAAQNLQKLLGAGFVSKKETLDGLNGMLKAGQLYYDQLLNPSVSPQTARDPRPFQNGRANMTKVITAIIGSVSASWNFTLPIPWNRAKGETFYIPVNTKGWYTQSLDAARTLTTGYVEAIRAAQAQAAADQAAKTQAQAVQASQIQAAVKAATVSNSGAVTPPSVSAALKSAGISPKLLIAGGLGLAAKFIFFR